jgi:hypothetical protein
LGRANVLVAGPLLSICCAVPITAFIVQSPARKSTPVGIAAKADEPPVAHHQLHPVRTIPIIGRTIPLEAQPAPPPASVTPQEQEASITRAIEDASGSLPWSNASTDQPDRGGRSMHLRSG